MSTVDLSRIQRSGLYPESNFGSVGGLEGPTMVDALCLDRPRHTTLDSDEDVVLS